MVTADPIRRFQIREETVADRNSTKTAEIKDNKKSTILHISLKNPNLRHSHQEQPMPHPNIKRETGNH